MFDTLLTGFIIFFPVASLAGLTGYGLVDSAFKVRAQPAETQAETVVSEPESQPTPPAVQPTQPVQPAAQPVQPAQPAKTVVSDRLTVKELRQMAKTQGITGYSKLTKRQLLSTLA